MNKKHTEVINYLPEIFAKNMDYAAAAAYLVSKGFTPDEHGNFGIYNRNSPWPGLRNIGDGNLGDDNIGTCNTGGGNYGHRNLGSRNRGDDNHGWDNVGDRNKGGGNVGNDLDNRVHK